MPSPFPGVDPYLEAPELWEDVHARLANEISAQLQPPANKRFGTEGHESYRQKRLDLLNSDVHLLEIDLLRRGVRWPTKDALPDAPYFVFLSRANRRPQVEVWPMTFREPPMPVPVPLRAPDHDVTLDLAAALARVYEQGAFSLRINYRSDPPAPGLSAADTRWLDARLQAAGLR